MEDNSVEDEEEVKKVWSSFLGEKRLLPFMFWFTGLGIVIPVITYTSSTFLGFVLVAMADFLRVSSLQSLKPFLLGIDVVCAAAAFYGYYKLWVIWRGKELDRHNPAAPRERGPNEVK